MNTIKSDPVAEARYVAKARVFNASWDMLDALTSILELIDCVMPKYPEDYGEALIKIKAIAEPIIEEVNPNGDVFKYMINY